MGVIGLYRGGEDVGFIWLIWEEVMDYRVIREEEVEILELEKMWIIGLCI